jgi:flagellar basal body rod protein FlgC
MNSSEFTLWLHGYLEALETEGIEKIKIRNIREKMGEIKNSPNQERIVYGPNVKRADQQGYVNPDTNRPIV